MPAPSDDEIDYLLSRGTLGGSQRRRILDSALAAASPGFWTRWRGRLAWTAGGLTLVTGTVALLLVARPPRGDKDAFRAKGIDDGPLITMSCLGARVNACPSGARVAFALEGGRDGGGFFTAYAEPVTKGERIWYLTNEPIGVPAADASPRVIPKAALIGEEQPPGVYRIHALFTERPVARQTLAAAAHVETLARVDLELVVQP